eukprot:FN602620.1.p1 GENE.FN602620.1~~FN602620.1.p1  ORF type:complete len:78 (-),score=2.30 FN602620.1:217-450(-)
MVVTRADVMVEGGELVLLTFCFCFVWLFDLCSLLGQMYYPGCCCCRLEMRDDGMRCMTGGRWVMRSVVRGVCRWRSF